MTEQTARSGWQNGVMAATSLVVAGVGAVVLFGLIAPRSPVLAALAALLWACGATTLGVRAFRLGVYAEPPFLVVRGMVRTWRIHTDDLIMVKVVEQSTGRGGRYFAPVIVQRLSTEPNPPGSHSPNGPPTEDVVLPWQAASSEQGAQRYAERIKALAAQARAETDGSGR